MTIEEQVAYRNLKDKMETMEIALELAQEVIANLKMQLKEEEKKVDLINGWDICKSA